VSYLLLLAVEKAPDLLWRDPTHGASAPAGAGAPTIGSFVILAVVVLVGAVIVNARGR
jgi:hypothetical protein